MPDSTELAGEHLGLVGLVMNRLPHAMLRRHGRDDLESAGRIGLVKAAQSYDPARGRFSTFAVFRIRGAILDELRTIHGRSDKPRYRPTLVPIDLTGPRPIDEPRFDAEDLIGLSRALETLTPRDRELIAESVRAGHRSTGGGR